MKVMWYIDTNNKLDCRKTKKHKIFFHNYNNVLKSNIIGIEISYKDYDIFCNYLKKIKI